MIPITDYENQYSISECGAVTRLETGKVLAHTLNKQNGYLYVSLWKNNKGKTVAVHRLVALAYIPNPDNKPFVNHKNSNRADPLKDNLEWCTQSENIQHGYDEGFMSQEERRNFKSFELELLLKAVLAGEAMAYLATAADVGLTRLTINLRNTAKILGLENRFDEELYRQKVLRNTAANANKKRAVVQLTPSGVYVADHESITAAAKALGKSSSGSIANALNPAVPQQLAFGFAWKYT